METFRFLNFQVYKDAKLFNKQVFVLSNSIKRKNYELSDQLARASLSVCLNIAEGSAKNSDKDFRRFIQTALGSANEVVACLDMALSLDFIRQNDFIVLSNEAKNIAKQLGGLSRTLLNR
jgi:four helix bundle protein